MSLTLLGGGKAVRGKHVPTPPPPFMAPERSPQMACKHFTEEAAHKHHFTSLVGQPFLTLCRTVTSEILCLYRTFLFFPSKASLLPPRSLGPQRPGLSAIFPTVEQLSLVAMNLSPLPNLFWDKILLLRISFFWHKLIHTSQRQCLLKSKARRLQITK